MYLMGAQHSMCISIFQHVAEWFLYFVYIAFNAVACASRSPVTGWRYHSSDLVACHRFTCGARTCAQRPTLIAHRSQYWLFNWLKSTGDMRIWRRIQAIETLKTIHTYVRVSFLFHLAAWYVILVQHKLFYFCCRMTRRTRERKKYFHFFRYLSSALKIMAKKKIARYKRGKSPINFNSQFMCHLFLAVKYRRNSISRRNVKWHTVRRTRACEICRDQDETKNKNKKWSGKWSWERQKRQ